MTDVVSNPNQPKKRSRFYWLKHFAVVFVVGFLAGWVFETYLMASSPFVGLYGYSFWRLLWPF